MTRNKEIDLGSKVDHSKKENGLLEGQCKELHAQTTTVKNKQTQK